MPMAPIPAHLSREHAIEALSRALGETGIRAWHGPFDGLFDLARDAGAPSNTGFVFRRSERIGGAVWHPGQAVGARLVPGIARLGDRRIGCEYPGTWEYAAPLDMLELPGATLTQIAHSNVLVAADGVSVVEDASSAYAPLLHFYDFDFGERLSRARHIPGTAFPLLGDAGEDNYSHWLLDDLPRLALLRDRPDVKLIISDAKAPWRRESLDLAGFPESRIVTLGRDEAVRADTMLVADTRELFHPARKGEPWVSDWIRARIGVPAMSRLLASASGAVPPSAVPPTRLYIGRGDARERRLTNEAALLRVLEPAGFVPITLSGRTVAEQVGLFARAEAVIGLHGAALANTIFCGPGTSVLEIFPPAYGTAAFGLVGSARGLRCASYVAEPDASPDRPTDCVLDIPAFWSVAGPWLRAARP